MGSLREIREITFDTGGNSAAAGRAAARQRDRDAGRTVRFDRAALTRGLDNPL